MRYVAAQYRLRMRRPQDRRPSREYLVTRSFVVEPILRSDDDAGGFSDWAASISTGVERSSARRRRECPSARRAPATGVRARYRSVTGAGR